VIVRCYGSPMRVAILVCLVVLGCSGKRDKQDPLLAAAKACSQGGELDVDRLHEELVERHAIIRMPPTNMAWGLREMHVGDRDGNVIRFASPIEHD
jgi:hypothetical protein